jgi:acyl-CoA thioester hydrolase
MDVFGHINNANYLTYFEEARIKYLDDITEWKYGWSKQGIIMARAEVDFKIPAKFKDQVIIKTRCSHVGTKSFTLEYNMIKIEEGNESIIAIANTVVVMFDYEKHTSIPIPENWRKILEKN